MADPLECFIDPTLQYRFMQDPRNVRSIEDARTGGINCITLAHLAVRELFAVELPPELHFSEAFLDRRHFTDVPLLDDLRRGDLVWFGLESPPIQVADFRPVYRDGQLVNYHEFPVKHVAIATGNTDARGEPTLLHATHIAGTNVVWPLNKFAEYARYRKVYGISRLLAAADAELAAA